MKTYYWPFLVGFCLCVKTNVLRLQVHFHVYQTHFHMKSFARELVLTQRHKETRKWRICSVLHCASLLRTIFASLARAHERQHVHSVRDFSQAKLDSEINAVFSQTSMVTYIFYYMNLV